MDIKTLNELTELTENIRSIKARLPNSGIKVRERLSHFLFARNRTFSGKLGLVKDQLITEIEASEGLLCVTPSGIHKLKVDKFIEFTQSGARVLVGEEKLILPLFDKYGSINRKNLGGLL